MNEVEEMYKLTNVAKPVIKKWYYDGYYEDFSWQSSEEDCTELLKYFDNSVDKLNDRIQQMKKEENTKYDRYTDSVDTEFGRIEKAYIVYPSFTAEKQIELFKWLIQRYKDISIEHKLNLFYINIRDIYTGKVHIEFDETIAGLISNLWQSLTEEEKQRIKEILE